jgi:hypothetical protein
MTATSISYYYSYLLKKPYAIYSVITKHHFSSTTNERYIDTNALICMY